MAICNCIIHALQFKKRIHEALDVLKEMSEQGCLLNVMNCNLLIKHLQEIWMENFYKLLKPEVAPRLWREWRKMNT